MSTGGKAKKRSPPPEEPVEGDIQASRAKAKVSGTTSLAGDFSDLPSALENPQPQSKPPRRNFISPISARIPKRFRRPKTRASISLVERLSALGAPRTSRRGPPLQHGLTCETSLARPSTPFPRTTSGCSEAAFRLGRLSADRTRKLRRLSAMGFPTVIREIPGSSQAADARGRLMDVLTRQGRDQEAARVARDAGVYPGGTYASAREDLIERVEHQ